MVNAGENYVVSIYCSCLQVMPCTRESFGLFEQIELHRWGFSGDYDLNLLIHELSGRESSDAMLSLPLLTFDLIFFPRNVFLS